MELFSHGVGLNVELSNGRVGREGLRETTIG